MLLLLFVAILLASALEPMVGLIRDRLPLGRGATILVVYATFFVTVLGPRVHRRPGRDRPGRRTSWPALPAFFESARAWAATCARRALSTSVTALIDSVAGRDHARRRPIRTRWSRSATAVAEAAVALATLLTLVFFWLVEHARLQRYVLAYLPADRRAGARDAWNEIETRLGPVGPRPADPDGRDGRGDGHRVHRSSACPGALLLGLIAAITEAIPIVGPLLGAIPAVLVAATVSPELALIVAGVYVVLQLIEGSVLVPLVMRNTVGISPLLVLLSLLSAGRSAGSSGRCSRCRSPRRPRSC